MQYTPVLDLAYTLHHVPLLEDERRMRKYLARMQDTFEMINPTLLRDAYNQAALLQILTYFKRWGVGSALFREKIADILQTMVEKKLWNEMTASGEIADMISCLRDIDVRKYEPLIEKLMEEFRQSVESERCSNRNLVRVYLSYLRLFNASPNNEESYEILN